jgi:hypothetical protein
VEDGKLTVRSVWQNGRKRNKSKQIQNKPVIEPMKMLGEGDGFFIFFAVGEAGGGYFFNFREGNQKNDTKSAEYYE